MEMVDKVYQKIRARWLLSLAGIFSLALLVNIGLFYPGYMSNDSVGHLGRALGAYPVTDLSPAIMTLVWRTLIDLTGFISSLLIMQLSMLWLSLWLIARYIFITTKSRKYSLLPLIIGLLPFVLNISGVIWTDNQLAFALLLTVSLLLQYGTINSRRWRITLIVACLLLVIYAGLVRYNALLAMVPLIFYIWHKSGFIQRLRWQWLATAGICGLVMVLVPVVNYSMHAQASHPESAVMIDDVLNVASEADLRTAALPQSMRDQFIAMKRCKEARGVLINNFWVCGTDAARYNMQHTHSTAMKKLWLHAVTGNPMQYMLYRTETFATFLFAPESIAYIWQDGITTNDFGQQVAFPRAGNTVKIYVNDFGYRHFSFFFQPWFWAVLAVFVLVRRPKIDKSVRVLCIVLSTSSLIYIISYFPTGATGDYRYIYWPVLAMTLVVLLLYFSGRSRPSWHNIIAHSTVQ